jgi:hypothetical protein
MITILSAPYYDKGCYHDEPACFRPQILGLFVASCEETNGSSFDQE